MFREFVLALAALLTSALLTAATIRVCHVKRWLFHPRVDRWSTRSVAKFGGVPIILSFALVSLFVRCSPTVRHVVCLTAAMALLGLWDDLRPMKPLPKLLIQLAITFFATWLGVVYPIGGHHWISIALSALWIAGMTNGFNLLDNMDGLSAGVAMIAALNLYFVVHGAMVHAPILLPFAGALLGFLIFNFNPAKIFMGDAGSLAIGFFVGCMALLETQRITQTASVLLTPVLVLLLPIFDTTLVSITRRLNGRAIGAGAKDHSSHRLVLLGLSERNAVLTLYVISALGGLVAYVCMDVWPQAGLGLVLLFLTGSMLFWLYLAQLRLPDNWLSRTNVATLAMPEVLESLSKRALMIFVDVALFGVSLYLSFILRFDRVKDLSTFFALWAAAIAVKVPALALFGAYRHTQPARSLRELYPIAKGALIGFFVIVSVWQLCMPDAHVPRAVFGIDLMLTFCLLAGFRVANHFFNDVVPGRIDHGRCIMVGNASAVAYQHFLAAKSESVRALALTAGRKYVAGVRAAQVPASELPALLEDDSISRVYLLPDCPEDVKSSVVGLCRAKNISVAAISVKVVDVHEHEATETITIPLSFGAKTARKRPVVAEA